MSSTTTVDLSGLDTASREIVEELENTPFLDPMSMTPTEMRAAFDAYYAKIDMRPADVEVDDLTVTGPGGDLVLRVYRPVGANDILPITVFCRGGGQPQFH